MKRYFFCITSTAYATNDTYRMYKLILAVCFPFATTGSWDFFAIKSAAEFGLVFFQVNDFHFQQQEINPCSRYRRPTTSPVGWQYIVYWIRILFLWNREVAGKL